MMRDIYIVRHGNTFDAGDIVTRVGGRTDLDLSVSGHEQARHLANHFQDTAKIKFASAYCSQLKRTRQTADIILAASARENTVVETLGFLKEIDYGPDENCAEEAVIARIGQSALDLWDTQAIPPQGWLVDPNFIRTAWARLFENLAASSSQDPVLIVTSNGIARFALDAVTKGRDVLTPLKLKTGAFGRLRLTASEVELINWNVRP